MFCCVYVDIIALKCIPIGVMKLICQRIVISLIIQPIFSFIFVGNCFIKVKYTIYWAMKPNILIKEWFANTTKKYVIFVCYQKEIN